MMKNPLRGIPRRQRLFLCGAALVLLFLLVLLLLPRPAEQEAEDAGYAPQQTMQQQTQPDAAPAGNACPVTAPQEVADYLFAYGKLPDNFLTRREAEALGWDGRLNDLSDIAPGMSLGGDRFGNYEGLVPRANGRTWWECDVNYLTGPRGRERIVYSSDGMVFYSDDHYETFTQMFPSPD